MGQGVQLLRQEWTYVHWHVRANVCSLRHVHSSDIWAVTVS